MKTTNKKLKMLGLLTAIMLIIPSIAQNLNEIQFFVPSCPSISDEFIYFHAVGYYQGEFAVFPSFVWTCVNGVPTLLSCPSGLEFNCKQDVCVFPMNWSDYLQTGCPCTD